MKMRGNGITGLPDLFVAPAGRAFLGGGGVSYDIMISHRSDIILGTSCRDILSLGQNSMVKLYSNHRVLPKNEGITSQHDNVTFV